MTEASHTDSGLSHYTDLRRTKATRKEDPFEYQAGFGNHFRSELIPGTLPQGQNHPQICRFNLYTEVLTSSAFAAPRHANMSSVLYRCRPSCAIGKSLQTSYLAPKLTTNQMVIVKSIASQAEWAPFELPDKKTDFVDGVKTVGGSGDANLRDGIALHIYAINSSMENRATVNADGDFMLVAQLGHIVIQTEMGRLYLQPGEIAVIPRGIKHRISLVEGYEAARGYLIELYGSRWELPTLGPIGCSGLANPRDFLTPVAFVDEKLDDEWLVFTKINGEYSVHHQDHSPFDVAAWHGNCVPFKYDLTKFVSVSSVSVDHTDPSVFTVLTAKSRDPDTPLADFLWFGPRWDVAQNTFRPPFFHRNAASEFLANIYSKANGAGRSAGFKPGGGSYEAGHIPHGGFSQPYLTEMKRMKNDPRIISPGSLTFMLESSRSLLFTEWGLSSSKQEATEAAVWKNFPDRFSTDPIVRQLLEKVKARDMANKEVDELFYDDDRIAALGNLSLE
ncbi:hypothetical protein BHE90_015589 [Fusarium euwallaceae]|uniref:homogentisate 1,2-dioxygenase n=1 Tax=Fusarium euwallaceae TaxID=1147111 RepID=A0A430L2R1_9HYPO|nr:hypothetical protein BHE90_015589 [Fusarium euwallaceae]